MSAFGDIMEEVKDLIRTTSKVKPHDDREDGYREGYSDALAEVYDMLVLYQEDE